MPRPDDVREEAVTLARCAACGEPLKALVPAGLKGKFFHPACNRGQIKSYEDYDVESSEDQAREAASRS